MWWKTLKYDLNWKSIHKWRKLKHQYTYIGLIMITLQWWNLNTSHYSKPKWLIDLNRMFFVLYNQLYFSENQNKRDWSDILLSHFFIYQSCIILKQTVQDPLPKVVWDHWFLNGPNCYSNLCSMALTAMFTLVHLKHL